MRLRHLVIAGCVLLSASPMFARSPEQAADPISGKWMGDMAPKGAKSRTLVTLELKFDGKTITGTIVGLPQPGEVKTGTFNRETGAIKLEASPTGDSTTRLVFEGTVSKGTATGRVTSGTNEMGDFKIRKATGDALGGTQQVGATETAAALRKSFGDVSGWVTKAADMVPANRYIYQPTKTVRTFGQLVGHIADGYTYFCGRAAGQNVQWSDAIEKGRTDKTTVVPKLKQALDICHAAYGGTGQVGPLVENVGHTNLHYGNIITYMRMLGLVPPSS